MFKEGNIKVHLTRKLPGQAEESIPYLTDQYVDPAKCMEDNPSPEFVVPRDPKDRTTMVRIFDAPGMYKLLTHHKAFDFPAPYRQNYYLEISDKSGVRVEFWYDVTMTIRLGAEPYNVKLLPLLLRIDGKETKPRR